MFTEYEEDIVFCILEIALLVIVSFSAIFGGQNLAIFLSNRLNIPYDLSLTAFSIGFGNEVIVVTVVLAIALTIFIYEKAIPKLIDYIVWH